jgi:hypothetical protein
MSPLRAILGARVRTSSAAKVDLGLARHCGVLD